MESILEITNLTKEYNNYRLHINHLVVPKGCIMGFIGENGAGKSTTIKLILNLIKKKEGSIRIFGKENTNNERQMKNDIGIVFDENNFPDTMNLNEVNVVMKHVYDKWDEKTFIAYTKRFQLPNKKELKEYSRGMKMKLSIAVALSHQAKFLILDEATSGLDPVVRDEILDVFLEFVQDEEHAIFISSHITSDLQKIADYIAFIHEGNIVLEGEKDNLLYKYGILKCTSKVLDQIDKDAIIAYRRSQYSTEALVNRDKIKGEYTIEKPTLDDIMLFYIKGNEM